MSRTTGLKYDGEKEVEAYEYGLEQRKKGNGQDLDLLIEATDYLDSIGESGIMEEDGSERHNMKLDIQYFAEKDISKQSDMSLKKGIFSFEKQIEIHTAKIEKPEVYYENWSKWDKRKQDGLKKHWEKEIYFFKKAIAERKEELKRRSNLNEGTK
ncbi:MAG: hypothetical protein Q4G23_12155 [Clostridia bacterium]|nr:hypothetical protein [Clostridia bacterium]